LRLNSHHSNFQLLDQPLKASLNFLDLGPDRVTIVVYGAIRRSIIGEADFSIFLLGASGRFKTEIAALAQQHFGPGFDSRNLPASFLSTGNAMEKLAFRCKDALMVIDDFHPPATGSEREKMIREATRVFRAQGNRAGRARMNRDLTLVPAQPPRGLFVATGEDQLPGYPLNSRLFTAEVHQGDIDVDKLTVCQRNATRGLYAQTTAAFIKWLAPDLAKWQAWFREQVACLHATFSAHHPRTADMQAQLTAAYAIFAEFLFDMGVFTTPAERNKFGQRATALQEATDAQKNLRIGVRTRWNDFAS